MDVLVAWLTTDTSLIEPSHLSVSVDELLSEHSLLMLPVLLEMLLVLPFRFCVWKSCDDQLMARDCSSWLSWRNLYFSDSFFCGERSRIDGDGDGEKKSIYQKPLLIIIYSLFMYVCCHWTLDEKRKKKVLKLKTFKSTKLTTTVESRDEARDEKNIILQHFHHELCLWVALIFKNKLAGRFLLFFRSTFEGACMAVVFPPSLVNYWERTIGNIGKIKQLELENQNLIPLMTNTSLHAKWKFISWRERQRKKINRGCFKVSSETGVKSFCLNIQSKTYI